MKKALIAIIIIGTALILSVNSHGKGRVPEGLYPMCGIVTEVDYLGDLVTYEDFSGNLWSFYGTEDWMVGDVVSAIMNDMGTDTIYDDEVLLARYSGYQG